MLSALKKFILSLRDDAPSDKIEIQDDSIRNAHDELALDGDEVPRYPPFIRGLPVISPERLVDSQAEVIKRIRESLGLTPNEWDTLIMPLIVRCAAFVHLLPASESHHHRGAGGLFRHSLEAGAWAAQLADARIFSYGKTPLERKHEEPRWVVATFVAALLHDIGKAATDMAIVSEDGSIEWNPYLSSLWDWGKENNVLRYYVRWRDNRYKNHEQSGLLLTNQILTREIKAWLGERNPEVISTMLEASTCRGSDAVTEIVKKADSASVNQDLKTNQMIGNEVSVAVPVERHLLDACRRLIRSGTWTINKKGSRVWVTKKGVFIVWRSGGAEEIVNLLSEDRIPGIPRDPDTLADLLLERSLASMDTERDPNRASRYWEVSPSVLDNVWLNCLKISHVETLFSSEPPAPLQVKIKGANNQEILIEGSEPIEIDTAPKAPKAPKANANEIAPEKSDQEKKSPNSVQSSKSNKPTMRMPSADETHHKAEKKKEDQLEIPLPTEGSRNQNSSKEDLGASDSKGKEKVRLGEESKTWFTHQDNDAARLLLKIFDEISLGIKDKDEMFGRDGNVIYLRYPGAIRPYGKPSDITQHFSQVGWIIPDPENPSRKARDMGNNNRGLVMSFEVANHINQILTHGITPPKLERPEKTLIDSPSNNKRSSDNSASQTPMNQQKTKAAQNQLNIQEPPESAPKVPPKSSPAAPNEASQSAPNNIGGRPPQVVKKIKPEVIQAVDKFVVAVRTGEVRNEQRRGKDGSLYYVVGHSRLIQFGREFSGNDLKVVCEQRPDCYFEGNSIWVKSL